MGHGSLGRGEALARKTLSTQAQQAWRRASRGQQWDEQSCGPHGSPTRPASQKPSPGPAWEPGSSKPHPTCQRLSQCPSPGREREWLGGWSPTSWATRLEMRTARLTRPFWALGCRAPVLLAFPAGAAMEDLAPPSLTALEPEGPASASPAPQQQSQPRLRPRGWRPGFQGSPWHEARVAGAGPWGRGHPGSECGQQPAWLGLPMAPWCGPRCQGAALCPPPAQQQRRGRNLSSSASPSSQVPTPTLPHWAPPPRRSSAQPARVRQTPRDGETAW